MQCNRDPVPLLAMKTCDVDQYILVSPRFTDRVVYIGHSADNDAANSPEHLQHLRCRGAQLDRYDLTAVCRSVGDEDTPWDTLQKLGGENDLNRFGEIEGEDENVQEHETDQGSPTISNIAGQRASYHDSDECAQLARYLECTLPRGRKVVTLLLVGVNTEHTRESLEGGEIADEKNVVRLHDLKGNVSHV